MLERSSSPPTPTPLELVEPPEGVEVEATDEPVEPTRGRGSPSRKPRTPAAARKSPDGHTLYIPPALWERLMVQAHRRRKTISDYVVSVLDRQVPDHLRGGRVEAEPPA